MKVKVLLAIILTGGASWAQQRMIPHVTRPGGGFRSEIIVANNADLPRAYTLTAFDADGNQLTVIDGQITGQTTLFQSVTETFGTDAVSHFTIADESEVAVTIAYQADREVSGPAHVGESHVQSQAWRVFPGNTAVTWDGMAVVNTGSATTDIQVRQVDANGAVLASVTAVPQLGPMAKGLYVFGTDFADVPRSHFEVTANQPLAITALRGNIAADFLWENRADPFELPLSRLQYEIVPAFPSLFIPSPVDLQTAPDGGDRLFVVSLDGVIKVFENDPSVNQAGDFLDIRDKVTAGGEMGLLGLAFHPNYAQNGYFYVNYTTTQNGPRRSVIARYQVSNGDANAADPGSELILLEVGQPLANHNGGQVAFGPDGQLYIALGDGGGGGDPDNNGQNGQTLLGSILRIDVDNPAGGMNYGIPADNPFTGSQTMREEIYAYGLRNPWRFSFDTNESGTRLWVADVGQNRIEEINLVEAGGNYGWNTMEGSECFSPVNGCDPTGLILPFFEYTHEEGDQSITGGYVYRGSQFPALAGAYIYGDFWSGRVWALQYDGVNPPVNTEIAQFNPLTLAAFGLDTQGEIYVLPLGGIIHRIQRVD